MTIEYLFFCKCTEGRKHDAAMLKDSQLLAELEVHAFSMKNNFNEKLRNSNKYCILTELIVFQLTFDSYLVFFLAPTLSLPSLCSLVYNIDLRVNLMKTKDG